MPIEEVTMLKNKAQAALEFLMTYGWALLVALVAVSALIYWGVLDLNFLPDVCTLGVGFGCISPLFQYQRLGTSGVLSFKVANQMGKDLSDMYVVVDPDNSYCGGWFGFLANSNFPQPPPGEIPWNGSAPFTYGEIRTPLNLLSNGIRWDRPIYCDCYMGDGGFTCSTPGVPGSNDIRTCCSSDDNPSAPPAPVGFSQKYFNSPTGLCPGHTSNINTCKQDVNMKVLKRFKSKLKIYYKEQGSNILHLRDGELNVANTGEFTLSGS